MKLREAFPGEAALYLGAGAVAFAGLGLLLGYAMGRKETPVGGGTRPGGWLPMNSAYGPQNAPTMPGQKDQGCDCHIESWLKSRTTIAEVEGGGARVGWYGIAVSGPLGEDWAGLKRTMRPGDELWTFSSPEESWRALAGRAGIALVRGGRVVDSMPIRLAQHGQPGRREM
jgi:hypothetical protein